MDKEVKERLVESLLAALWITVLVAAPVAAVILMYFALYGWGLAMATFTLFSWVFTYVYTHPELFT